MRDYSDGGEINKQFCKKKFLTQNFEHKWDAIRINMLVAGNEMKMKVLKRKFIFFADFFLFYKIVQINKNLNFIEEVINSDQFDEIHKSLQCIIKMGFT